MHPQDTALNDYVDGSLGPADRAEIDRHLAACASCRQTVDDLREIVSASRELELREPPIRVWSRVERAIKMERADDVRDPLRVSRSAERRTVASLTWLAAAAAL